MRLRLLPDAGSSIQALVSGLAHHHVLATLHNSHADAASWSPSSGVLDKRDLMWCYSSLLECRVLAAKSFLMSSGMGILEDAVQAWNAADC